MPTTLALNSKTLAAIDDLPLLAETIVEGFLDGIHRSPFLGYSTEFSAYRSYTQGDNLRHVDWKVWARTDELYVKEFEDDTNLSGQIFLDTSASMDFGGTDANKFAYGRLLAAALAQLMVRQRDAPGLVLFGAGARLAAPAQATRQQSAAIFQLLVETKAGGATRLDRELFGIVETFLSRGMAVVISDFFAAGETGLDLLRRLHGQRQEVIAFHLLAPEEIQFPYDGDFIMEDMETGEEIVVDATGFRKEYQARIENFCDQLRKTCVSLEIDYHRISTDQPLDVALSAYLERRAGL
jgi:uncharacterized protein (DUF58 family)